MIKKRKLCPHCKEKLLRNIGSYRREASNKPIWVQVGFICDNCGYFEPKENYKLIRKQFSERVKKGLATQSEPSSIPMEQNDLYYHKLMNAWIWGKMTDRDKEMWTLEGRPDLIKFFNKHREKMPYVENFLKDVITDEEIQKQYNLIPENIDDFLDYYDQNIAPKMMNKFKRDHKKSKAVV